MIDQTLLKDPNDLFHNQIFMEHVYPQVATSREFLASTIHALDKYSSFAITLEPSGFITIWVNKEEHDRLTAEVIAGLKAKYFSQLPGSLFADFIQSALAGVFLGAVFFALAFLFDWHITFALGFIIAFSFNMLVSVIKHTVAWFKIRP